MPFTVSHVAAVLPLRRVGLPAAPLAIGAVAPDLVFFLPVGPSRELSHSLVGAVTIDPALALVALLVWWVVLRRPLLDLAPDGLRRRMTERPVLPTGAVRTVAGVIVGILVGIATHLGWDWFTHRDALAAVWPPWAVRVGPLPLTSWLQYLSSVGGGVVLVVWARHWWRRTTLRPAAARVAPSWGSRAAWTGVAGVVLAVAIGTLVIELLAGAPGGLPALLFRAIVYPISAGIAAVLVVAAVWWAGRAFPGRTASRIRS